METVLKSRLAELLMDKEMSWRALSEQCGITQRTISAAIYTIEKCQLSTLKTIANSLGVPTKDLYEEVSENVILPTPQCGPTAERDPETEKKAAQKAWAKTSRARQLKAAPSESIQEDKITCLECGQEGLLISARHLKGHGLTVKEYKMKWKIADDQPLVSGVSMKARADAAKKRADARS